MILHCCSQPHFNQVMEVFFSQVHVTRNVKLVGKNIVTFFQQHLRLWHPIVKHTIAPSSGANSCLVN